jgi:putative MATE family efflux protein
MQTKRSKQLETTHVHKLLIQLAIPATIGMMINALYNLVDTIFVGRGVNEIAIGALSLAFPIQMIIMAVGLMIGIGSASVFSRAFGRQDTKTMDHSVNTALRIDIVVALFFTLLAFLFLDELLLFFKATESNIGYAKDYLSIIFIGLVPLTLSMVLNNLTRAEGRVKIAMISMILGAGTNIVLDPIFIFDWGLGLGVRGAALATVISQMVAFGFIFLMSISPKSALNIRFNQLLDIDFNVLKEIVAVGFPTFVRNAAGALLSILIFFLIAYYTTGDQAVYISIFGVTNRIIMFLFMPAFGLVQGLAPIAGYNYGAQKYERLVDVIKFAMVILVVYFTFNFLFVQLLSKQLFMIFAEDASDFFISYGSKTIRTISLGFILVSFQVLMSSVYQSFGYAKRAMFVALSRQLILFVPFVFILTYFFDLEGLWMTFAVADILAGIISMALYIYEQRVLKSYIKKA